METFRLIWETSHKVEQHAEDDCGFLDHYNDCACPDEGMTLAWTRLGGTARWQAPPNLYRAPLAPSYEMALDPLTTKGVVVFDKPVQRVLDTFRLPYLPDELPALLPGLDSADAVEIAHQLANAGLLVPENAHLQMRPVQPYTFNVWMHVTNACNLSCSYCYVDKTGERMDESTGQAAVRAAFRTAEQHGFRAIKFKYAGGEPTLNFGLVQTLHQQVLQLAEQRQVPVSGIMLSNGVGLTDEIIKALCDNRLDLMISLDGMGAAHDAHRHFSNGRGSFDMVKRGIERSLAHGLSPQLMITISGRNAEGLSDVVRFALERDLTFRFNFYREIDQSMGEADLRADHARLIEAVRAALGVIETYLPKRRLINGLLDRSLAYAHAHCCAADHAYMVVDPHGRIARCQMTIDQPVTTVWADDPLAAMQNAGEGFRNLPVDERQDCNECTWRYWCAGGCPLMAYRATGRSDVKSPYCDVYQALYPDLLRVEGLRLLKWNTPVN